MVALGVVLLMGDVIAVLAVVIVAAGEGDTPGSVGITEFTADCAADTPGTFSTARHAAINTTSSKEMIPTTMIFFFI